MRTMQHALTGARTTRAVLTAAFILMLSLAASIGSLAALVAFSVATYALPLVSGALAVGPGVAPIGSVGTGTQIVGDPGSDLLVPSISEFLHTYQPNLFAVTQIIDERSSSFVSDADLKNGFVHQWIERSRLPRFVSVNGASTAGSAGAAKSVTVDSSSAVVPGALLMALNNANATAARQMFIVTAVTSTTVSIKALAPKTSFARDVALTADAYGTVPAFADNELLYWVGNAKSEADAASQALKMQAVTRSNFIQTLDAVAQISDHAMRTMNYGNVGDWDQMAQDLAYEFRKTREASILFNGIKSVSEGTNLNGETAKTHTMTGLFGFVDSGITLSAAGSEAAFVSMVYDAFASDDGSPDRILMGGSEVLELVDTIVASAAGLQTTRAEVAAGLKIDVIEGRKGNLGLHYHPLFDEYGYADQALIIDFDHVGCAKLQDVEVRDGLDKTSGNMVDRERKQLISKETLVVSKATGDRSVHKRLTLVA